MTRTRVRDPWHQCRGKVKHGSQQEARDARARMAQEPGRENLIAILTAYLCPHCSFWHLGTAHNSRNRQAAFERRAEKQRRKALVAARTKNSQNNG